MNISEYNQDKNQTNIAVFALIASIGWFVLGISLVFATYGNGTRDTFDIANLFFFTFLLAVPGYGIAAWVNVRQESCRLLRIFRDCTIGYVVLSVCLFLLMDTIPVPNYSNYLIYLFYFSILGVITTHIMGYIIIIFLQRKLAFTLYIIAQSISILSTVTFSYFIIKIAASC
jgi:hypothetical protein